MIDLKNHSHTKKNFRDFIRENVLLKSKRYIKKKDKSPVALCESPVDLSVCYANLRSWKIIKQRGQ